jgi:segregation and condensation protein B
MTENENEQVDFASTFDSDKKKSAFVEMILFLESEPQSVESLMKATKLSEEEIERSIDFLKEKYTADESGLELTFITGGYALTPRKIYWVAVKDRYGRKNEGKLSRSALETLTIIAYKQPITRAEIESIRGVPPDNMIRMLTERKLVKEVGKKDGPGKPTLFGTTDEFLRFFQLNSIADLPKLDEKEEERFILAR